LEREDEITGGSHLRRERRQPVDVGLEMFEHFRGADADQQSRAARAHDPQRTARIEVIGGERERIEDGAALAIVQLTAHRRRALADRAAAVLLLTADLDVNDTRL